MDRAANDDSSDPQPVKHIDAVVPKNTRSVDEVVRKAEVNRSEEWGTIGLPIFLTPEELEKQGIDPDTTDQAIIRVQDGFLLIDSE